MDVEARLRAFAAVARKGSFSRAAEALYVSQPAVSKHVASLEAELGTQLVVRGRPGAVLTPAGQVLADYVLRAEALLANARRALAAGADADIGTLTLAASGIPGTYLVPEIVARFHERYPGVHLDFQVSTSAGTLELVRAHDVEIGIVGGMTLPPELEAESLLEDEVVLVGPPSLAGRRLRPKDLEGWAWISRRGVGDEGVRRSGPLADGAARSADARPALVGGRQARRGERRRDRRDQSCRAATRARDGFTRTPRRARLASVTDDCGRHREERPADSTCRKVSRAAPRALCRNGRAASQLEPPG
jgi:DNA-binding transcriptional LysR family regulator